MRNDSRLSIRGLRALTCVTAVTLAAAGCGGNNGASLFGASSAGTGGSSGSVFGAGSGGTSTSGSTGSGSTGSSGSSSTGSGSTGSSGSSGSGSSGTGSGGSSGGYSVGSGMSPGIMAEAGHSNAASSSAYSMTKLVSNGSVSALLSDHKLVNPWGLAFAPGAPVWIANNGSQTFTLYDGAGDKEQLIVSIPPGLNGAADPTGIVVNTGHGFVVKKGDASAPALFIFAGEGGTIAGWAQSVDLQAAITAYDDGAGHALYTGLALATTASGAQQLYAADFRNGKVDVFDSSFKKVTASGGFADSTLPAGYAPFGIQALTVQKQTLIYVTYAKRTSTDEAEVGAGLGLVDAFDTEGELKAHLIPSGGKLNAPWGVALAPASFGSFGNDLLVGNFGDGLIHAFNPTTGAFKGSLAEASGQALATPGLWGIAFGNGALKQPATTLFFTAGIGGGTDGLYGRIDPGATAPDLTTPSVHITAPAAGAMVSGTVTVTATASDSDGIKSVKLLAGTTVLGTLTSAPYSANWNTTTFANGTVELTAEAEDKAGNTAVSAPIAVTVSNSSMMPPPGYGY